MTTWTVANSLQAAPLVLILVIVFLGARKFAWLKTLKETNDTLTAANTALRDYNADLLERHAEAQRQAECDNRARDLRISGLEGQVEVLKTVPLQEIALTLKELAILQKDLTITNASILATLVESSKRLKLDTEAAAVAVQGVKEEVASHNQ